MLRQGRVEVLTAIAAAAAVSMGTIGGCTAAPGSRTGHDGGLRTVAAAGERERTGLIDRVKGLDGEWVMEESPDSVASVFTVSSNGSVVREIMFPGAPHEMTNVYHMDGPDLVMTHYCAVGNQPRMRAHGAALGSVPTDEIRFLSDSVTNLHSLKDTYMGEMTLVFVDADHIRQEWQSFTGGELVGEPTVFTLTRKR